MPKILKNVPIWCLPSVKISILRTSVPWKVVGLECPVEEYYQGSNRCDTVLYYRFYLIVIEIKYKKRVHDAIKQIEDRDYLRIVENEDHVKEWRVGSQNFLCTAFTSRAAYRIVFEQAWVLKFLDHRII